MSDESLRARERAKQASHDPWEEYRHRLELVRLGRHEEAGFKRGDRVAWQLHAPMTMNDGSLVRGVVEARVVLVNDEKLIILPENAPKPVMFSRRALNGIFLNILLLEPARPGVRPPRARRFFSKGPAERWCPVCETWRLSRPKQSLRSRRRGKKRLPPRVCRGRISENKAKELWGVLPLRKVTGHGLQPLYECPGPKKGEPAVAPLEALEKWLAEAAWAPDHEMEWVFHRIAVARRRAGLPPLVRPSFNVLRRIAIG